jgi:hypothetical protein
MSETIRETLTSNLLIVNIVPRMSSAKNGSGFRFQVCAIHLVGNTCDNFVKFVLTALSLTGGGLHQGQCNLFFRRTTSDSEIRSFCVVWARATALITAKLDVNDIP